MSKKADGSRPSEERKETGTVSTANAQTTKAREDRKETFNASKSHPQKRRR
jgi:hypothetical protein